MTYFLKNKPSHLSMKHSLGHMSICTEYACIYTDIEMIRFSRIFILPKSDNFIFSKAYKFRIRRTLCQQ